jgi:heptosyltransferase I
MAVVMMSALGDAVHVLPLLDAIKRHAPATHVTWVLQPAPAQLVLGHPHVDDTLIFRREKGLGAYPDLRAQLKGRRFDLVLGLQVYFKAGIVTAMIDAPVKLGFDRARARDLNWLFTTHRIPPHEPQHVQDQYFEFLTALGIPHGEPRWNLAPTDAERAAARGILAADTGYRIPDTGGAAPVAARKLVGFVVATSKPEKNWMPERYAELADRLAVERNAQVVLLGGNAPIERMAADAILAQTKVAKPIDAMGKGIRTLLGLLEACDVVVSSDTGPYHMCVAMNVPAVGLYGYTNMKRVGPYRRFTDLAIDAYGDPGENYPISMAYRHDRMQRITVDMVSEKVARALQSDSRGRPRA